jgi:GDPmannose 4,6-dehydratase
MWRMLQQMEPDDYVLATGEAHSVREFVERCFAHVGRRLEWRGEAGKEEGVDAADGRALVKVDPAYYRPAEVDFLLGDATKARERMGWIPTVGFEELVRIMMDADLAAEAGARG